MPQHLISLLRTTHVLVSLASLVAGAAFVSRLIGGALSRSTVVWFTAFLTFTVVTALIIHPDATGPAHVGGFISLALVLATAIPLCVARPPMPLRFVHVVAGLAAFYVDVLAAVVTAFQFVPGLQRLTPTLAHPPLAASQLAAAMSVPAFTFCLAATTVSFSAAAGLISRAGSISQTTWTGRR